MKLQVGDHDVIEVIELPRGDIRLTVSEGSLSPSSITMTRREAKVVMALIETLADTFD